MNGTIKTYSILGWALAIGKDFATAPAAQIDDQDKISEVNSIGTAIHDAADHAIRTWPRFTARPKTIHALAESIKYFDSIGYVRPGEKRVEVVLATLLAALDDIAKYAKKPKRKAALNKLINNVMDLSILIDPTGDQADHYFRGDRAFQRWLEGKSC